jgi:hypothetical protein
MGSVVHGQALIRWPAIVDCVIGRNTMVYVPRRKMGGKRESIGASAEAIMPLLTIAPF